MEFDKFVIGFEALELGEYNYNFLVDDAFFNELEYAEIQGGEVIVGAVLRKSERLSQMELNFEGKVAVPCDRCSEDVTLPVSFTESLIVKVGTEDNEDEGLLILGENDIEFNIKHYLYESISLSLPTRRIHSEDDKDKGCDEAILSMLNQDNKKDNDKDDIDPRWSALKNLK